MLLFFFLIGLHAGWDFSYCKGTHYFLYTSFLSAFYTSLSLFLTK